MGGFNVPSKIKSGAHEVVHGSCCLATPRCKLHELPNGDNDMVM